VQMAALLIGPYLCSFSNLPDLRTIGMAFAFPFWHTDCYVLYVHNVY